MNWFRYQKRLESHEFFENTGRSFSANLRIVYTLIMVTGQPKLDIFVAKFPLQEKAKIFQAF
uniref:Uncharacterized protein n=1 Tax=Romanomermis culicivorax TaxID=13658 RepID=A0A915IQW5_ROMCU